MAHSITESNVLLWQQLGDVTGRRVLDVSCGPGTSTRALLKLGLEVTCTNYTEERHPGIPEGATYVGGVDLNVRWPFEDASFDGVHLQEVIEHLENPVHVITEVSRILVPGGQLVLSTPNMLNLRSRLHFLLTGFYEGRRHPIGYSKGLGDAGNCFIPPLHLLHYVMAQRGITIRALGTYRVHPINRLLYPLALPFLALATWLTTYRPRKSWMANRADRAKMSDAELTSLVARQRRVARRVRGLALSREALLSRNLVLRCEKTGGDPFESA